MFCTLELISEAIYLFERGRRTGGFNGSRLEYEICEIVI